MVLGKPVSGTGRFQLVVGKDFKRKLKLPVEFVLPLFGEAPWADDETTLKAA